MLSKITYDLKNGQPNMFAILISTLFRSCQYLHFKMFLIVLWSNIQMSSDPVFSWSFSFILLILLNTGPIIKWSNQSLDI